MNQGNHVEPTLTQIRTMEAAMVVSCVMIFIGITWHSVVIGASGFFMAAVVIITAFEMLAKRRVKQDARPIQ